MNVHLDITSFKENFDYIFHVLRHFSCVGLFVTLWTVAHQSTLIFFILFSMFKINSLIKRFIHTEWYKVRKSHLKLLPHLLPPFFFPGINRSDLPVQSSINYLGICIYMSLSICTTFCSTTYFSHKCIDSISVHIDFLIFLYVLCTVLYNGCIFHLMPVLSIHFLMQGQIAYKFCYYKACHGVHTFAYTFSYLCKCSYGINFQQPAALGKGYVPILFLDITKLLF